MVLQLLIFSFSVWSMKSAASALNLSSGRLERSMSTSPEGRDELAQVELLFLAK